MLNIWQKLIFKSIQFSSRQPRECSSTSAPSKKLWYRRIVTNIPQGTGSDIIREPDGDTYRYT